jgi:hypothetical protein
MADEKVGPTGKFPDGKINDNDDGELRFSVGIDRQAKNVVIDFGIPIKWLALPKKTTLELSKLLADKANYLED